MNSHIFPLVFVSAFAAMFSAQAAPVATAQKPVAVVAVAPKIVAVAPVQPNVATFAELDALRSQNALLAERVKAAEMQAKLSGPNPSKGLSATMPPFPTAQSPMSAPQFDSAPSPASQVQMVSNNGNSWVAVVSLANGGRVQARVGSTIPGLGIVQSISLNEVVVSNKKQSFSLPFAVEPVMAASASASAVSFPPPPAPTVAATSMMPMPPLPARGSR